MSKPALAARGQTRGLARAARRLLAAAAATVQAVPDHPDLALLTCCAEYGALQRQIDRLFRGGTGLVGEVQRGERHAALLRAGKPILLRICRLKARTQAGHSARAAAFVAWDAGDLPLRAHHGCLEDVLLLSIVADLVQ